MKDRHLSRRKFLRAVAIAGPASTLLMIEPTRAQELPIIAADDPLANALQYVADATASTAPNYQPGQNCVNCNFIQGEDGAEYRPCLLFPGKSIAAAGWCISWATKP